MADAFSLPSPTMLCANCEAEIRAPWDRWKDKGESHSQWLVFHEYLMQPPGQRNVRRLAAEKKARGERPHNERWLEQLCARFSWVERAMEWDTFARTRERERNDAEDAAARSQVRREHRETATRVRRLAQLRVFGGEREDGVVVPALDPEEIEAKDLVKIMGWAFAEERRAIEGSMTAEAERAVARALAPFMKLAAQYVPADMWSAFLADLDVAMGVGEDSVR